MCLGKSKLPGISPALQRFLGYGDDAKRKSQRFRDAEGDKTAGRMEEVMDVENEL